MTLRIVRITHEQLDEVAARVQGFTCRGPRYVDDESTRYGDEFLCTGAWAELDRQGITRTFVAVLDGEIVGYVSLTADSITLTSSERKTASVRSQRRYGCVQIVMIASRADTHERGDVAVGTALLEHAQLVGREVGESIGARFLAADVNPASVAFYKRAGFVSLKADAGKPGALTPMMLDLRPMAQAPGDRGAPSAPAQLPATPPPGFALPEKRGGDEK